MSEKKKGPWQIFGDALVLLRDLHDMNRHRLRNIENRLAALDGGDDTAEAPGVAYDSANADRRRTGNASLGFKRP